ncbi:MAG: winged helix-turn-helix domain-containing protein [Gammaproteobacteria bacterium]|nr:winged helix-turn-helix domain-containing protein [Gammaproteobacteria bacterium]
MSETGIDILLVEDDLRLADLTAQYFRQNGLSVAVESRGDLAITRFMAEQPRVVLLDLMLPGTDGLTICRELREIYDGPILIFTARDSDIDQVIGLEAGADDYVSKPVDPMVLLARTRALLRRVETEQHRHPDVGDMVLGGLRISEASQQVWLDGAKVTLTTHEFELLRLLARHAGKVLRREDIFRHLRGIEYDGLDRSIDGRISKLRRKLQDSAEAPTRIKTVWGKGYLLVPDAWGEAP